MNKQYLENLHSLSHKNRVANIRLYLHHSSESHTDKTDVIVPVSFVTDICNWLPGRIYHTSDFAYTLLIFRADFSFRKGHP